MRQKSVSPIAQNGRDACACPRLTVTPMRRFDDGGSRLQSRRNTTLAAQPVNSAMAAAAMP